MLEKKRGACYSLARRGVKRGFCALEASMKHLRPEQMERLALSVARAMYLIWRMNMA